MERKTLLIPIFLILLIGIITCIGIFTNAEKKNDTPKTTTTKKTATTNAISPVLMTVVLEINPKIALELNEEEIVINMYPLNDDAKQYTREEYIGKSLEKSIEKVVKDTKSYINKNKKITVSVIKGETSYKESKLLSIKSKVVNKIKAEDKTVKVEEKEMTATEIKEVIENIKDIKTEDKLPENTATTTTTEPTENTSTTTSSKKTTTTTKKTTTKATTTTTKKPDYNLNENIKIMVSEGDIIGIYVFPNKAECKNKLPEEVTIPDGETYDSYCQNKIPSQPVVKGKGYYCSVLKNTGEVEPGVTATKTYLCEWISDIVSSNTIKSKLQSVLKAQNGVNIGGGMGGADEITLDEDACNKFSLNCGRW